MLLKAKTQVQGRHLRERKKHPYWDASCFSIMRFFQGDFAPVVWSTVCVNPSDCLAILPTCRWLCQLWRKALSKQYSIVLT